MTERVRRRRSRDLRIPRESRENSGLSPASRLRIAADVHRHSTSDDDSGCVLEEYAWVPSGLKPDMVHLYFSCLPDDKVPYVNSAGEKWRQRQLRYQLPPQDSDGRYCGELSREEEDELRMFERGRKSECLGRGLVQRIPYDGRSRRCRGCTVPLDEGDICVFAARTDTVFHPACFHCHECRALLVDLIYFAHDGQIFCGRHHAEQIKPRCARCDELIFGEECTEAEGRTWHLQHFQCSECADVLGGKKYMQRNNKPVCLSCFHSAESSLVCATCRGNIPVEHPHISQGDLDWHADARCFSCCVCSKNLLGKKYSLVDASLYCGFKTCGGDDELLDMDRLHVRTSPEKIPSSLNRKPPRIPNRPPPSPRLAPRPPQRAPPPPPSENIYETVLPCTSSSPEFEKKYGMIEFERGNYYSRTPSKILGRGDTNGYSTSSSDSEEDETFYINNLMAAASLSRAAERRGLQQSGIRMAKKKKSNRCIVS